MRIKAEAWLEVNLDGRIVQASGTAAVLFQRRVDDLRGMTLTSLGADAATLQPLLDDAREDGALHTVVPLRWADGTTFQADVTALRVQGRDGTQHHLVVRDLTEPDALEPDVLVGPWAHQAFVDQALPAALLRAVRDATGSVVAWEVVSYSAAAEPVVGEFHPRGTRVRAKQGEQGLFLGPLFDTVHASGTRATYESVRPGRIVSCSVHPLKDDLIGVVFEDVTTDRQARAERDRVLEETRARAAELQAIFDAVPTPVWITQDPDGKHIVANVCAADMLGVPRDTNFSLTLPADQQPQGFRATRDGVALADASMPIPTVLRTGQAVRDMAFDVTFTDGSVRNLLGHCAPLRDAAGTPRGAVAAFLDVTALRQTERQLRDLAVRFDAFMASTPIHAWIKDSQRQYVFVNNTWVREFGLSTTEVLGKTDRDMYPEPVAQAHASREAAVLAHGDPSFALDYFPATESRDARWYRGATFRFLDSAGTAFLAGIGRNITAEKFAEDALRASEARARQAQTDLEHALELTRRTEEKLRQSQKMEAVGRLAGGVAHDFNNLLTVILSSCEFLESRLRGDPDNVHLTEIAEAGHRAAELTRQLLAFSRRQVLEPRVLSLNDVVRGVESMMRRLLGEDVEITVLLDPGLHLCRVDPGQVEQVILNLVVNARDAMPEGGRLTLETANVVLDDAYVRTHPEATAGPHTVLSVSDTGTGMTPETLARLFEPFFTTKPEGKGTGLGLSTVYGIVKQSGGTVWVYSEPGQGTTFKVYFPQAVGLAEGLPVKAAPVHAVGGRETILLVEDHQAVRTALRQMLIRVGYHVIEASNGGEALLICEQHGGSIHLLLTDVVMPKLNGRLVAERLVKLRPDMKVIFISGYTENVVVHHGVLDSGVDFLQKPLTADVLLPKVREVLDRAPSR